MSKPALVILPGWGGTKTSWTAFTKQASTFFDVSCLELPCFGDEPCPKTVWGIDEYAAFVVQKLETHQGRPVILLGHSFGGQVAAVVATKRPDLLRYLVLSASAMIRPKKTLKRAVFAVLSACGRLVFRLPIISRCEPAARRLLYRIIDSPDYLETQGIKREIFRKVIRQNAEHLLSRIALPTLVLWGSNDRYTPLKHGKQIAQRLPNATLKIFRGGTHGLHLSKTKEMIEAIRSFVQ